jgi:hypothetical protein
MTENQVIIGANGFSFSMVPLPENHAKSTSFSLCFICAGPEDPPLQCAKISRIIYYIKEAVEKGQKGYGKIDE